jgi:MFS family permease
VATLPGRTHGLGYITRPLLKDLHIGAVEYSSMNFWAIVLGSIFCWPVGRLLDRFGTRTVLTAVSLLLGGLVILMSEVTDWLALFAVLFLVRGLGQGALSVVSIALVGKWFRRRIGIAMGVYTVLLGIGFSVVPFLMVPAVADYGWRQAWAGVGLCLIIGMAPIAWLLVRSTPEACGLPAEPEPPEEASQDVPDALLVEALRTPAFWLFSLAMSLYGLLISAFTLFPEAILEEHGFNMQTYKLMMSVLMVCGLVSNLVGGWLATRWPHGRVLGVGMVLLSVTLAPFPLIFSQTGMILYGAGLGVTGSFITVIFFVFYSRAYGRTNLGQIQGVAQGISVFASALGPVLLTVCKEWTGSFDLFFYSAAPLSAILGLGAWMVPVRRPATQLAIEGAVA